MYSDYKIVAFNEAYEYLLSQKEKYSHIKIHDDETVKKDIVKQKQNFLNT